MKFKGFDHARFLCPDLEKSMDINDFPNYKRSVEIYNSVFTSGRSFGKALPSCLQNYSSNYNDSASEVKSRSFLIDCDCEDTTCPIHAGDTSDASKHGLQQTIVENDVEGQLGEVKCETDGDGEKFLCPQLRRKLDINNYPFYKKSIQYFEKSLNTRRNLESKDSFVLREIWKSPRTRREQVDTDPDLNEFNVFRYKSPSTSSNSSDHCISTSISKQDCYIQKLKTRLKNIKDVDISDLKEQYSFLFDPEYVFTPRDVEENSNLRNQSKKRGLFDATRTTLSEKYRRVAVPSCSTPRKLLNDRRMNRPDQRDNIQPDTTLHSTDILQRLGENNEPYGPMNGISQVVPRSPILQQGPQTPSLSNVSSPISVTCYSHQAEPNPANSEVYDVSEYAAMLAQDLQPLQSYNNFATWQDCSHGYTNEHEQSITLNAEPTYQYQSLTYDYSHGQHAQPSPSISPIVYTNVSGSPYGPTVSHVAKENSSNQPQPSRSTRCRMYTSTDSDNSTGVVYDYSSNDDNSRRAPSHSTNVDISRRAPSHNTNVDISRRAPCHSTNDDNSRRALSHSTNDDNSRRAVSHSTNDDISRRAPCHSTNDDISRRALSHSTNDDISRRAPSHNTNEDISRRAPSHSTNDDISRRTRSHNTNDNISRRTRSHNTNDDISRRTRSHSTNSDISRRARSRNRSNQQNFGRNGNCNQNNLQCNLDAMEPVNDLVWSTSAGNFNQNITEWNIDDMNPVDDLAWSSSPGDNQEELNETLKNVESDHSDESIIAGEHVTVPSESSESPDARWRSNMWHRIGSQPRDSGGVQAGTFDIVTNTKPCRNDHDHTSVDSTTQDVIETNKNNSSIVFKDLRDDLQKNRDPLHRRRLGINYHQLKRYPNTKPNDWIGSSRDRRSRTRSRFIRGSNTTERFRLSSGANEPIARYRRPRREQTDTDKTKLMDINDSGVIRSGLYTDERESEAIHSSTSKNKNGQRDHQADDFKPRNDIGLVYGLDIERDQRLSNHSFTSRQSSRHSSDGDDKTDRHSFTNIKVKTESDLDVRPMNSYLVNPDYGHDSEDYTDVTVKREGFRNWFGSHSGETRVKVEEDDLKYDSKSIVSTRSLSSNDKLYTSSDNHDGYSVNTDTIPMYTKHERDERDDVMHYASEHDIADARVKLETMGSLGIENIDEQYSRYRKVDDYIDDSLPGTSQNIDSGYYNSRETNYGVSTHDMPSPEQGSHRDEYSGVSTSTSNGSNFYPDVINVLDYHTDNYSDEPIYNSGSITGTQIAFQFHYNDANIQPTNCIESPKRESSERIRTTSQDYDHGYHRTESWGHRSRSGSRRNDVNTTLHSVLRDRTTAAWKEWKEDAHARRRSRSRSKTRYSSNNRHSRDSSISRDRYDDYRGVDIDRRSRNNCKRDFIDLTISDRESREICKRVNREDNDRASRDDFRRRDCRTDRNRDRRDGHDRAGDRDLRDKIRRVHSKDGGRESRDDRRSYHRTSSSDLVSRDSRSNSHRDSSAERHSKHSTADLNRHRDGSTHSNRDSSVGRHHKLRESSKGCHRGSSADRGRKHTPVDGKRPRESSKGRHRDSSADRDRKRTPVDGIRPPDSGTAKHSDSSTDRNRKHTPIDVKRSRDSCINNQRDPSADGHGKQSSVDVKRQDTSPDTPCDSVDRHRKETSVGDVKRKHDSGTDSHRDASADRQHKHTSVDVIRQRHRSSSKSSHRDLSADRQRKHAPIEARRQRERSADRHRDRSRDSGVAARSGDTNGPERKRRSRSPPRDRRDSKRPGIPTHRH